MGWRFIIFWAFNIIVFYFLISINLKNVIFGQTNFINFQSHKCVSSNSYSFPGNPRNDIDDGITSSYKPLNEPDDGNKRALDGPDTGRPTKFPLAGTDLRPISGFPKNEAKHPADFEGDPNKKAPALGDDDSNWSRPFGDDDNRSSRPDSGIQLEFN